MLRLSEIANYYPENLLGFQRFIIREYLQYKICKSSLTTLLTLVNFASWEAPV